MCVCVCVLCMCGVPVPSIIINNIAPFHRLQTCLGFLLLLPLLVLVYQIQPFNVVELYQHSPLSNNTSVTTYIHRMIMSLPCLFKHKKKDERVTMLSQCLLDHTQQNLYFCLISFLRNNVSKSVYINLRHSVFLRTYLSDVLYIIDSIIMVVKLSFDERK